MKITPAPNIFKALLQPAVFVSLGALFAVFITGWRVVNPLNNSWFSSDAADGYLGWLFFRNQENLSFPLGWSSAIAYPFGEPIAYLDSIPIVAASFWPLRHMLGDGFQYQGMVLVAQCVLQLYFGYRIALRLGGDDKTFALLAAFFFMSSAPVIWRAHWGQFALVNHWPILAALDVFCSSSVRLSWRRIIGMSALCFVAGGINPYIQFMVLMVVTATHLKLGLLQFRNSPQVSRSELNRRLLFGVGFSFVAAALALYIFGFIQVGRSLGGYAGEGYGRYSMNVLAPIDPMEYRALLFKQQPTLADKAGPFRARAQVEGYNYLGLGMILLATISLARRPDLIAHLFKVGSLAGWTLFLVSFLLALSLRPTFGTFVIYEFHIPPLLLTMLSTFRASGRLFWPAFYLVFVCIIGATSIAFGKFAKIALMVALVIQFFDLRGLIYSARYTMQQASSYAFTDGEPWQSAAEKSRHLVVIPAWQCDADKTPGGQRGYWIFGKLAAKFSLTTNSFYAGRTSPEQLEYFCKKQPQDVRQQGLRNDTAYVFSDAFFALSFPLNGNFCERADGVVLCSHSPNKEGLDSSIFDGSFKTAPHE